MIIAKVKFTVECFYPPNEQPSILSTIAIFEDRGDIIYYSYDFRDIDNNPIGGRSWPIYKTAMEGDPIEAAIEHARYNIDNFLVDRKRIFKVIAYSMVTD